MLSSWCRRASPRSSRVGSALGTHEVCVLLGSHQPSGRAGWLVIAWLRKLVTYMTTEDRHDPLDW